MNNLMRGVLVLIALGVVLNTAGTVVALVLNGNRVDQINAERLRNTERSCRERSDQNAQIQAFLVAIGNPTPEMVEQAKKFFPVRTPTECAAMARAQVTNP